MAVVINYDQLQKERTIRPRSPQEKAFANDQLIPFYNKMIDRYSPNAIVLVMVNICSPLKELETVERGLIKGIKGCLMHTNIGIVLQSMMAGSCNLVIPLRSIESIKISLTISMLAIIPMYTMGLTLIFVLISISFPRPVIGII